jgi:hypothetical protein
VKLDRLSSGPNGLLAAETDTIDLDVAKAESIATATPVIVDPAHASSWSPAFSATGTLAVASNRSGDMGIWISHATAPARELAAFGSQYVFDLSWSPDASKIAFGFASNESRLEVRMVDLKGNSRTLFRVPGSQMDAPAWSDDGKSILLPFRDPHGWRLWLIDVSGHNGPTTVSGYGWRSAKFRGGAIFAVKDREGGLWKLEGNLPPRLIDQGVMPESNAFATTAPERGTSWQFGSDGIVTIENVDNQAPRILAQPIAGGPVRVLGFAEQYHPGSGFDVDPVSGVPVYIMARGDDSDIVLLRLMR